MNLFPIGNESGYSLQAICQNDMEAIRQWRNSQIDVLRQNHPLSRADQERYFVEVVEPTLSQPTPPMILCSLYLSGKQIGYGGLTHIDWTARRGELSFLIDPTRAVDPKTYRSDFLNFLELLTHVTFGPLHFHRLWAETFSFRTSTIQLLREFGFQYEGTLVEHVYKQGRWCDSVMLGLLANGLTAKLQPYIQTPEPPRAVLISSIGNKFPMLKAVKEAICHGSSFYALHGSDSNGACPAQWYVDSFWHAPNQAEISLEALIAHCQQKCIEIIIPSRDGELTFYAENKQQFKEHNIAVMISTPEAIHICLDKLTFSQHLEQRGLPAIPTALSIDSISSDSYVVKERFGAGSRQIGLNLPPSAAIAHGQTLEVPIFQPYIPGEEWSIDIYRTAEGKVHGAIARRRNLITHGEAQITTTQHRPDLESLAAEVAQQLDLYGHAVIQMIESCDGQLHIVECNPRFGGASTASIAAGLDSFGWFFAELQGLPPAPFQRLAGDIRQIRHPSDLIIPW
jgi:carbamoyl-phosphate synthase large subunit